MSALEQLLGQLPDRLGSGKSNHIFTPKHIAKDMVAILPEEVFHKNATFLDICCKSGIFLYEVYNRLMNSESMIRDISDKKERREYILNNQLFGIAPDPMCQMMATRTTYGYIEPNSHIIDFGTNYNAVMQNTDKRFLYDTLKEKFGMMKFDVVIGNPPYNKGMDLDFVDLAYKLSKEDTGMVCMITPAKWQTSEPDQTVASKNMNYGQFREQIVPHMSHVVFYPDAPDIFDIAQTDGITYFLIEKNKKSNTTVVNKCDRQSIFNSTEIREINNRKSLINIGNEIIEFINKSPKNSFKFGDMSKQYKVYTASKVSKGASPHMFASDGRTHYLGISRIIDSAKEHRPEQECSQSFSADTREECESFVSYINTRFVRFLLICNVSKLNGLICNDCFRFVPAPPSGKFDHIYTDDELYKVFNLPQKYRDVIEAVIKERK